MAELQSAATDLVLLDLMLPDQNGLEVCRALRASARTSALRMIMLAARSDENDLMQGLGAGADVFITKPFRPKELLARIAKRLALHRQGGVRLVLQRLEVDAMAIDTVRHEFTIAGEPIQVTLTEFHLLNFLASNRGIVHARRERLAYISECNTLAADRTIDLHIRNLWR
jgi:DNA-binding response OmpR family regulator